MGINSITNYATNIVIF